MSEQLLCLDARHGGCAGEVIYREGLTGTGTTVPRCDQHYLMAKNRAERRRPQ